MTPENPHPRRESLLSVLLIVTIVLSAGVGVYGLAARSSPQKTPEAPAGITVGLKVSAYHPGQSQPYAVRNLPQDLVLNNFNNYLLTFMAPGQFQNQNFVNSAGTTGSKSAWHDSQIFDESSGCGASSGCGGIVAIGTSTTAPARTDYGPGAILGTYTTVTSSTCSTGTTDSVVFSGSVAVSATATVTEAVGGVHTLDSADQVGPYYFFHDTFTGIAVVSGDTVDVQYTVSLGSAGFNVNLCNYLAGLFSPITSAAAVSVSLTDSAGTANTFYMWVPVDSSGCALSTSSTTCSGPAQSPVMGIGTGTTAYTPTTHWLTTAVATTTTLDEYSYVSGTTSYIYLGAGFTGASGDSITEAVQGLVLSSNDYLFFGSTFTAQSAGSSFGITMDISD
ncbi:MAG: hypothetical protein JRN50_04275 [Nitrososphaerota archaeon]|nr:hypothetical protein [Nitrososphaerota archaeon]